MAVSIYDYTDYRAYLDAWLHEKKSRSVRGLATRLEISASQVSMVRSGRRNLNLEHARHWGWGLRLDDNELDHWDAMVRAAHAPTEQLRSLAARQLQAAQAWQNAVRQSRSLDAYSNWYGMVIKEMATLPGFQPSGEWMGSRLHPPVEPEEAERILELLIETGQLIPKEDGTYGLAYLDTTTDIQVGPQAGAAAMVRAHKAWLNLGHDVLAMPPEIRHFGHITLSLDQGRLHEVVAVLHRLHIESAEATKTHEPNTVYEIGLAVLPRTDRIVPEAEGD